MTGVGEQVDEALAQAGFVLDHENAQVAVVDPGAGEFLELAIHGPAQPGATVRYTLDGSVPTATTGTTYARPIWLAAAIGMGVGAGIYFYQLDVGAESRVRKMTLLR